MKHVIESLVRVALLACICSIFWLALLGLWSCPLGTVVGPRLARQRLPNTACTRQVGFAPLKRVDSVLKHFPSTQFRLVPPTCG
jgi:hypothetical protein